MAELVCFRHAAVTVKGLCYGRADVPVELTPEAACAGLDPSSFERVWSSPSARCADVARALVARPGPAPRLEIDERLYELDFGEWESKPWDELPVGAREAWAEDWKRAAPPAGESLPELEERVREWHQGLAEAERHLLIAHAGVVRALWVIREGIVWDEAMSRAVPHTQALRMPTPKVG